MLLSITILSITLQDLYLAAVYYFYFPFILFERR